MIVNIKPLFMICILFFTPLSYSIVDKEIVKHPYCHNLYVGTVAHIGFSETLSLGEPDIECDSAITQKGLTKKETKSEYNSTPLPLHWYNFLNYHTTTTYPTT